MPACARSVQSLARACQGPARTRVFLDRADGLHSYVHGSLVGGAKGAPKGSGAPQGAGSPQRGSETPQPGESRSQAGESRGARSPRGSVTPTAGEGLGSRPPPLGELTAPPRGAGSWLPFSLLERSPALPRELLGSCWGAGERDSPLGSHSFLPSPSFLPSSFPFLPSRPSSSSSPPTHLTFFLPPPSTCYASLLTLQPPTLAPRPWHGPLHTPPTACRRLRSARAYDTGLSVYSGMWERGCNKLIFTSLPLGLVSTCRLL